MAVIHIGGDSITDHYSLLNLIHNCRTVILEVLIH